MRVIGYARVSTEEQARNGASLEGQRRHIEEEVARRGWELVGIDEDSASGKTMQRPGLQLAIQDLESGKADTLLVTKLDRLSRSVIDFANLMERSRRKGWALVALDLGVDTTTPAGEMIANVMASVAQWERRIIGQRTKEGLAVKRSQGIRLGRPPVLQPKVRRRIQNMRDGGASLPEIAQALNVEGIPTAHGGRCWYSSTVRAILHPQRAA